MASSRKATLLRLPRYDAPDPDQCVLVHATSTSATQPLNLQLHATEGERAFAVKLRQSKIYELRAKSYTGTAEDLGKIFSALLLKQDGGDLVRGVELAAAVDDKCLTVRQDIGGIKQRIAALQIPEEEVEIPIFEWAAEACAALDNKSTQLDSLRTRVSYQEKELEKLMAQVKDLVAFKKEHEETLLVKFSELLNSKKAKIRELSRELEMARMDNGPPGPSLAEEPEVAEPPEPGPSRTRAARGRGRAPANARKRKPVAPPTDSESDGGFVKMDVEPKGKTPMNQGDDDGDDETEDEEGNGGGYLRQEVPSDRSVTEDDDDELPPVRRPIAFTMRQPDKSPEKTPEKEDKGKEMEEGGEELVRAAGRGRGRGGRGRGKGSAATASPPPARRGRGRGSRAKPKEPTPSPPSPQSAGGETADSGDDEL